MDIVLLGGWSEVFIFSWSRRGQVLVENLATSHSEEPGSGRGGACRRPSIPSHSPIARDRGDSPGEAEMTWRRFWGARFESGARETPRESLRHSLRQFPRESQNAKTREAITLVYIILHTEIEVLL